MRGRVRRRAASGAPRWPRLLLERCRLGEAIEAAHAAIRADPLRESAHRQLLRAHLASGNVGEALRTYDAWREMARRELNAEPSREMRALMPGLSH